MTDEQFMDLAIEKAREGIAGGGSPFGACIVKDGAVVACVPNVVWQPTDITAHAEIHALRVACRSLGTTDLTGCIINSTCEPCPMCFGAIHWARIGRIVFGASIADAAEVGFDELPICDETLKALGGSPVEIVAGCLWEENRALFRDWASQPGRRAY
jgi:tRNA(Arg) A34 adenosine deaminase TadA